MEQLLHERGPKPGEVSYEPLDLDGPQLRVEGVSHSRARRSSRSGRRDCRIRRRSTGTGWWRLASMGWIADLLDVDRLPLLDDVRSLLAAAEYRRLWETHVHWTRLCGRTLDDYGLSLKGG